MAKIALVSDVHLGVRQWGIKERYEDFLATFERFGREVVKYKPDAVVIGGDLFDSSNPDARSVNLAQCVVRNIKEAGIPVYGIDGNHDLADGWWLRTIGAQVLCERETVDIAGTLVTGIPYRNGRDLVDTIREMGDAGMKMDVLVAHFALAEMNGGGTADTSVQELSPLLDRFGVKFVMMGHVHISDCRTWNGVTYVNPGSTELKSFNEPKEKYWFMVDTSGLVDPVPMRLETRPVEYVDIATEEDIAEFMIRLECESRAGQKSPRTLYQVVVSGDINDAFRRLAKAAHDNSALARIVMRTAKTHDHAPMMDHMGSVSKLGAAIEARFPKESAEARLIVSMLHSPEPSAIRQIVDKFMAE